jgi:hypothetical protein
LAEKEITLQPGFYVASGIYTNRMVPSEEYSMPIKVATYINLLADKGILLEKNSFLHVTSMPKRNRTRSIEYQVKLSDTENIFATLKPFAGQAIMTTIRNKNYETLDNLALALDTNVKKFPQVKRLPLLAQGKFRILSMFYPNHGLAPKDIFRLIQSEATVPKIIEGLDTGLDVDTIALLGEFSDGLYEDIMGLSED